MRKDNKFKQPSFSYFSIKWNTERKEQPTKMAPLHSSARALI